MRGVILCAVAALAALAATAGSASADRGGVKHVTVLHPVAPAAAPAGIAYTLRNAGAFTVRDQGAREFVTLASASGPKSLVYDLQLSGGTTAAQLGPRAVAFVRNGAQVGVFVAPAMLDASGAISRAIDVTLHGNTIAVTPSSSWLASASYPVTVDPETLSLLGANQDTYIESGSPSGYFAGDPQLLVGNDGTQTVRGLLDFNIDMYVPAGATVDSAQLSLNLESATTAETTNVDVSGVTDRWSDATWRQFDYDWQTASSLPWTTPGGDTTATGAATAAVAPTPGTATNWNLTQLVQQQVSGLAPSDGFLIHQDGETTTQLLAFTSSYSWNGNPLPTLTVTWEDPSTSGAAVTFMNGNSIWFGAGSVGTTMPTQEIDLQNSGSAALSVSSLALTGPNAADFSVTGSTCVGAQVAPTATCAITIAAKPSYAGNESATLVITDNAPNSPQYAALAATGLGAAPSVLITSGNPVYFGSQTVGTTTAAQQVGVENAGNAPLSVSSLSLSGAHAADFRITGTTCTGAQVQPGATCTVTLTATPSVVGDEQASLAISDNAPDSPQSVTLDVEGTASVAATVSPSGGLDFGNLRVGKTSGTKYVTVKSSGSAALTLGTASVGGTNASDFTIVSNGCSGRSLAPGASCTVGIRARASARGNRSATLTIADNAPAGSISEPLAVYGT